MKKEDLKVLVGLVFIALMIIGSVCLAVIEVMAKWRLAFGKF